MKIWLVISALLSLCIVLAACGNSGAGKPTTSDTATAAGATAASATSSTASSAPPALRSLKGDEDDDETGERLANTNKDNDVDFDNDLKPQPGYNDSDDGPVRDYGRPASTAEESKLEDIAVRYYSVAARGDGATGCSLTDANFAKSVPEDYGSGAGPAYARGKTCPVVLTAIFKHAHAELAGAVRVTAVRVKGGQALVLVGSTTMPARFLALQRTHGVWGVVGLLGTEMP
ncbi:MAG TPA: hypothetical protein VGI26_07190 [Solirubrobacteraceae bacterium]|jgi:predicted small secreted protein